MIRFKSVLGLVVLLPIFGALESFGGGHSEYSKREELSTQKLDANRSFYIKANDNMRFSLENIEVFQGDVIAFTVENTGKIPHEFVIGSNLQIQEHKKQMSNAHGDSHSHSDGDGSVFLKPGEIKKLLWKFSSKGDFLASCNLPGHHESGMFIRIKVI